MYTRHRLSCSLTHTWQENVCLSEHVSFLGGEEITIDNNIY